MLGTAQCFDSKDEMFRVCQLSSYICCLKALTLKAFTLLWGAAFTAFHLLLYIPFSRTSGSEIHKPTRYFSAEKSKTNKSLHTNLPPFQKISEVSSSFPTCKWTISILLKKLSGSSNCLFQPWLLLVCFALVLSFVCLLLWVLHSIEMTADSEGNGDFFFPGQ